jgi:hypothetical protein
MPSLSLQPGMMPFALAALLNLTPRPTRPIRRDGQRIGPLRNKRCPCGKTKTHTIEEPIDLTRFGVEGTATHKTSKTVGVKLKHCCAVDLRAKSYVRDNAVHAAPTPPPAPKLDRRVTAAAMREVFRMFSPRRRVIAPAA